VLGFEHPGGLYNLGFDTNEKLTWGINNDAASNDEIWHAGNSNTAITTWQAYDMTVAHDLIVNNAMLADGYRNPSDNIIANAFLRTSTDAAYTLYIQKVGDVNGGNIADFLYGSTVVSAGNSAMSVGSDGIVVEKTLTADEIESSKYFVSALNTAPSSATDTGTTGEIRFASGHIYLCISTNVWVRTQLTTW